MYRVDWTKQARKDYRFIVERGLEATLAEILRAIRKNPFESTPKHRSERLLGYKPPIYTRRLDYHNRFVYTVESNSGGAKDGKGVPYEGIVVIHRMWGHFP
jgi:Txe/YoeB family toxin of Txe-Axe toxin-antitoxin module